MPGNSREIRDIASALARLNTALKSAGLGAVSAIGLRPADLMMLQAIPPVLDYGRYLDPAAHISHGPLTIIGIPFISYEEPTEAPPP